MRRRPVEDDGEEVDGGQVQSAGHRGPAHQRWKRARRAADHDVLRARALEPDGVDEDVEQEPAEREPGAERIDLVPEDRERQRGRAPCRTPARRRALIRPAGIGRSLVRDHPGVDVPVEPHVDRVGPARHQVAADHHPEHQDRRREPRRGDEHRRDGGHQQQRDDPGLGEGDEVGEPARARSELRSTASGTAFSGVAARSGTPARPARPRSAVPTRRCSARSPVGSRCRIIAAATAIWTSVAPSTMAAQRRTAAVSMARDRRSRLTSSPSTTRNPKARARWLQCSRARSPSGGKALPLQRGKPRQRRPASKLATWAPKRITTKPERRRGQHQPVVAVPLLPCELAAGTSGAARSADHEERRQQHHRVREVGDDDPGREDQLDGDRAQEDLDHQQERPRGGRGSGARARSGADGVPPRQPRTRGRSPAPRPSGG